MAQRWTEDSNRFTLVNTTRPTEEPVSLVEAKLHLRVDVDDTADDDLISELIVAARQEAENACRRTFVASAWLLTMDRFPNLYDVGPWSVGVELAPGRITSVGGYMRGTSEVSLPLSPVISVDSIKYQDSNGAQQTLAPSGYEVDVAGYPATITPAYGAAWPVIRSGRYGVAIGFTAGFGDASAVPAAIKAWMKIKVATLYRNREGTALFRGTVQDFSYVDRLLDPFRLIEF